MATLVARIVFTQQLKRFTAAPEPETPAATLRDRGHLRGNVVAFIDGRRRADRQVRFMQALSRG